MRFDKCPTCKGVGIGYYELGIGGEKTFFPAEDGDYPCPTCQDSDGKPTGEIVVLSADEQEHLRRLLDSQPVLCPECVGLLKALDAHRDSAGKKGGEECR